MTRATSRSPSSSHGCRSWSAATGPNVTWRLAAKHADELNLDGMDGGRGRRGAARSIRSRCEEIDRDPATLAISVHVWGEQIGLAGQARVDRLAGYRDLGVSRVMGLIGSRTATSDEILPAPLSRTRGRPASNWPADGTTSTTRKRCQFRGVLFVIRSGVR